MKKFHRSLSLLLCLTFLFSFAFSPIRAHAYFDPAYSTAYIVVGDVVVEGIKEGSKLIASAILSVWDTVVTEDFLKTCQGVLELGSFFTSSTSYKGIFDSYSEGELSAGQTILSKAFLSSVAAAYKTKTGITLPVPDQDVSIYVPPESVWTEAELITSDRLNYRGFGDLTEVNKNILAGNQITWQLKQDFSSLAKYLRTDLVDFLRDEYSSLTSSITLLNQTLSNKLSLVNSSLGDVETSVDVMSSTLSKHFSDLKSLYSQFGNATLSKLDALNTSIQAINGFDLSEDFKHLKELETQFGNATLDSLDDLITSTDYITASVFTASETLSSSIAVSTEELSAKLDELSVEVTLPDVSELLISIDSISGEILLGISDLVSVFTSEDFFLTLSDVSLSAESLASLNDITLSIADTVDVFNGAYDVMIDRLDSLSFNLSEFNYTIFEEFKTDFLDPYLTNFEAYMGAFEFMLEYLDSFYRALDDFTFELSNFDTDFASILTNITTSLSDIKISMSDFKSFLQTDIVEILNEIKTSIKSIAGTTTADPGIGDNDSDDEANKQKIPLIPHINNGFEQGENYIGNVYTFLDDELAGFRVAALIFEEFAGISFFYKLIITSCSVGLIATLLGMALNVQSYSVSQRRREEAAQVRAQYRMQRSTAA